LAIHQAFAAADITIAFPQVVVWPGGDADGAPYGGTLGDVHTGEVFTTHAAVPHGRERSTQRTSGSWLPWRRGER